MSDQDLWNPEDFIERRLFCPLEHVKTLLDRLRLAIAANDLLLLAVDENGVLRTLCQLSSESSRRLARFSELLQREGSVQLRTVEPHPLFVSSESPDTIATQLSRAISQADLYPGPSNGFFVFLRRLHSHQSWATIETDVQDGQPVRLLVWARGAQIGSHAPEAVRALVRAVNSTANMAVHRDSRVMRDVDHALRSITSTSTAEEVVQVLLEMACKVTSSDVGVAYEASRSGDRASLCPVAHVGERSLIRPRISIGEGSPPDCVAGLSFERRRPIVQSSRDSNLASHQATWLTERDELANEIAIPIPAAPGAHTSHYAGVLVCARLSDRPIPYGDYDLALLRNVALRIALARSAILVNEIANGMMAVADAAAHSEGPLEPELAISRVNPNRINDQHEWQLTDLASDLPYDLFQAAIATGPMIQAAARITGSHSATLRLLIPYATGRNTIHPFSCRIVAWPMARVVDENDRIALDSNDSVNAWVSRTGVPVYLADVRDKVLYRQYPGLSRSLDVRNRNTRAEVCAPIIVDGRLIGTINFESPLRGAYALIDPIISATAAQVALMVTAHRRVFINSIVSIGSDVQTSAHELIKLQRLVADHEPSGDGQIIAQVRQTLDDVISALDTVDDQSTSPALPVPFKEIVSLAARDAGIDYVRVRSDEAIWHASQPAQRRVRLALFEVLRNTSAYGATDATGIPYVRVSTRHIGGRDYIETHIVNHVRPAKHMDGRLMYRVPIRERDGIHIGAYVAGAILRSLGGEMQALGDPASQEFRLIVSVPHGISNGKV